jgi:hypothetical protein
MARPARPERSRSARSSRHFSRFYHSINLDRVFGTHRRRRRRQNPKLRARVAPDHHGYQRACVLISGQASTGHSGHQCSHAPGRPILVPLNRISSHVDAFGLFTGQIGYAWNNVLLYAKGGAAVVDERFNFISNATGLVVASRSPPRNGLKAVRAAPPISGSAGPATTASRRWPFSMIRSRIGKRSRPDGTP